MDRVAVLFDDTYRPETTGTYCRRAFEELVQVGRIGHIKHILPVNIQELDKGEWDLVVAIDDGLDYELPQHAGLVAYWAIDTHVDFERALRKGAQAKWVFAAQKNGTAKLRENGIEAEWLPLACDPELHGKQNVASEFDLAFVGNFLRGERPRLLELLRRKYPNCFMGQKYFQEMAAIYSASKIVFNRSLLDDINMRVFEALCSGSLLLTNDLSDNGLLELFNDSEHLVTYITDDDLCERIGYYLSHDDERQRIASAGRNEVLAKHTYRHRMESILDRVERDLLCSRDQDPAWLDEVDFGIKTFLRPEALHRLLSSIIQHYPQAQVTIVDDGNLSVSDDAASSACRRLLESNPQMRLVSHDFSSGVSAGRNALVDATSRPFFLLLDDDFCFTVETQIGRLIERLKSNPHIDVAAGVCCDWDGLKRQRRNSGGTLERQGRTLIHNTSGWRDATTGRCDYFPSFALFRRAVFSEVAWRGGVGGEHYDFCLQLQAHGYVAIQDESVTIDHYPGTPSLPGYRERRFNFSEAQQEFLDRWDLDAVIQNGAVILERNRTSEQGARRQEPAPSAGRCRCGSCGDRNSAGTSEGQNGQRRKAKKSCQSGKCQCKAPELPRKSAPYFEHERKDVQELVPSTARRILDIGCGAGRLGLGLKQRQVCHVTGVEFNPDAAAIARSRLDEVHIAHLEADLLEFDEGQFDCVICADILEHLRNPERLLSQLQRWLKPDGALVISLPNVRNHAVIQSLLAGNWTYESAGLLDADHVRFFTRREVEKLLFRSGFDVEGLRLIPGEGFSEWQSSGMPNEVSFGGMKIQLASPEEASELFAYQYVIRAIPQVVRHQWRPSEANHAGLSQLRDRFPWPNIRMMECRTNAQDGWLGDGARAALSESISKDTKLIVELGSWLGLSTRFMADLAPQARVIAIDHWNGSAEHQNHPTWSGILPQVYDEFLHHCWDYRDRIQPVRTSSVEGLEIIAEAGLQPNVIYIDADHTYEAVLNDIKTCIRLFPDAVLIGDDYDAPDVHRAVAEIANDQHQTIERFGDGWHAWKLVPPTKQQAPRDDAPAAIDIRRNSPADSFGLTSIVIVTWNQLPVTQMCLDSIRLRTDEAYEIIVVDNGSTDGTVDYLKSLPDITLIENTENQGFPKAVNQGLQVARGDNLLLLNNDTVVTTGWLRRMLEVLHSRQEIGLVGPSTNCAGGEQQIRVDYRQLSDVDGFAWSLPRIVVDNGHDLVHDTDRLIGFCLLFKRDAFDAIGLLDERFGIGCFEDDDYCHRARLAGYRTVIARHAFVHHFGSVSFQGGGIDLKQVLDDNRERYLQKWSLSSIEEHRGSQGSLPPKDISSDHRDQSHEIRSDVSSEASSLPLDGIGAEVTQNADCDSESRAADHGNGFPVGKERPLFTLAQDPDGNLLIEPNKIKLSGCLIVRNNENTIRPCLETLRPWVDEMIVVDTGSTDATPQIAEELGARVIQWPWRDDFAAARNVSLDHARGEWLFWMDSDDTLPADCGQKLRDLAYGQHDDNMFGYVMQVHCPGDDADDVTVVDHIKLFRNRPDLRFEFRIHEQILPAIRRAGGSVAFTDVYVVHSGSDRSKDGQAGKLKRDFHLLNLELRDRPNHPFVHFNLGMTHADCGQHQEAIQHLQKCLEVSMPEESHVRKAYAILVSSLMQLNRDDEAEHYSRDGLQLYSDDKELLFRQAMIEHQQGRLADAIGTYRKVLQESTGRHFTSVDAGLDTFKTRHNLALVYEEMGDFPSAIQEWRRITTETPSYCPGWYGLIDALSTVRDEVQLAEISELHRQNKERGMQGIANFALARLHEIKGEIDTALKAYSLVSESDAIETAALRHTCRLLFETGRWTRAKQSLEELTKRASDDASAFHNLGIAAWQSGDREDAANAFRESLRLRPRYRETEELLRASQQCL